jgi:hypothetical protein
MAFIERGEYLIVMEEGQDQRILARTEHYEIAASAWMAAKFKFPHENLQLRKNAQLMQRHDGAPKPEEAPGSASAGLGRQSHPGLQEQVPGLRDGEKSGGREGEGDRPLQAFARPGGAPGNNAPALERPRRDVHWQFGSESFHIVETLPRRVLDLAPEYRGTESVQQLHTLPR